MISALATVEAARKLSPLEKNCPCQRRNDEEKKLAVSHNMLQYKHFKSMATTFSLLVCRLPLLSLNLDARLGGDDFAAFHRGSLMWSFAPADRPASKDAIRLRNPTEREGQSLSLPQRSSTRLYLWGALFV